VRVIQALRIPKALPAPRAALVFPLGFAGLFAGLFALYLYATAFVGTNSDNAGLILQAQAMLHGNPILHGWYLPPDSFLTTELPLDALLGVFFRGEALFRITPALLYAATVTGAAYLASTLAADAAARWLAAAACVALLAFPVGILFSLTMVGPIHFGTIAASLVAWWAYDRYARAPAARGALAAFVAVTALAVLGDPLAEVTIVAPVAVVCALALARARGREPAARALLAGAVVALVAGIGLQRLLILTGTHIASALPAIASPGLIWQHVQWLMLGICTLFHVDVLTGLGFDLRLLFAALNVVFLVVGVAGFAKFCRRALRVGEMRTSLTAALCWAIILGVLAFLFTDYATSVGGIRYLLPASVYAGILAYSAIGEVVPARHRARFVLALLLASVATFGVAVAQLSSSPVPERQLIAFLQGHHLRVGLGSYWTADITMLRSDGAIRLIPVRLEHSGIRVYRWHASDDMFGREQLGAARFIVIDDRVAAAPFQAAVIAQFGRPDEVYTVGHYTIFAWDASFIPPGARLG
jgi:hypothetical protein